MGLTNRARIRFPAAVRIRACWILIPGALLLLCNTAQAFDRPAGKLEAPTTTKSGSQYVLGPEDQILIRVLQAPEISDKPVRIDLSGSIDVPFIGQVKAGA